MAKHLQSLPSRQQHPLKGAAHGLRQPCCRFGVGAALLPMGDSRSRTRGHFSDTPTRQTPAELALKSGSRLPQSMGVLEGRERLAGGETTGSSARLDLPQDRAPAGAREASTHPAPTMTSTLLGRFSRPFWALGSAIQDGVVINPVVAPPANVSRASGTQAAQLAACLALAMLSISCGKKEAPKPTVTEAPKPAAVSDAKIDAAIEQALTPPAPTKSEVQAELEAQAEDILAKYPNKNAQDLLGVPEVNEALKVGLTKLSKDKKLQDQINKSVALAAKMQGLSGEPGTVGLDLDVKGYDHARKSRMVQAVISEDPKQIVRFLTEEIGEAVPELTLGGAERASNGVKIKETPPPAVPK